MSHHIHDTAVETRLRIWLRAWVRPLRAEARATRKTSHGFDVSVPTLGFTSGVAREGRTRGTDGTFGFGLALAPATLTIGSVDFGDADPLALEVTGQTGAIGSRSFDADQLDRAEVAQPAQQLLVPDLRRGEALDAEERSSLVQSRSCSQFVDALLDVPARDVILELTEHTLVDDYPAPIAALYELRRRGTRLSIDDTGSGYSSLVHILKLAPDFIKRDRDLVSGIDVDPVRRALAASLVTFAADTGAQIVAEGVETKDEVEVVRRLGVRYAQGYYLGHPSALDALANCRRRPFAALRALHQTS
jgi:EAL domain